MNKKIVKTGADILIHSPSRIESDIREMINSRVGILTSATGTDSMGLPTYEYLSDIGKLTVLFAPEHGIHSALQAGGWMGSYIDSSTGVPVFDIAANGNEKIDEALGLCDVVLYDIQDVGARFYTYIYCLSYLMFECAKRKKPVIILDRPDPIGGLITEGALLDESRYSSFVGRYSLPARYAMTCGEFANYLNNEKNIGCELYVIKAEGWERHMYGDETTLPWINPSPNIPSVDSSLAFIGTCLIEATNVSEGRGTTRPFELVGAPFIDGKRLSEHMNSLKLPGVYFTPTHFTPVFSKCANEICSGIQINISDRDIFRPHHVGLHILSSLRKYKKFTWRENGINLRYGKDSLTRHIDFDPDSIVRKENDDLLTYNNVLKKYLLY